MLLVNEEKIAILSSQKKIRKRGNKMKQSKKIIAQFSVFVKEAPKDVLQSLVKKERLIYLA